MATDTFTGIVQLAMKIVAICWDVFKYGLASRPICGLCKDAAWKAMPSPCAGGAVPAAAFMLLGRRLHCMVSDTFVSIAQLAAF